MRIRKAKFSLGSSRSMQGGFSLLELLIATVVLMVGIVAVVQLVPASLQSNANNRVDTTATVMAQRQLDQILSQPLTASSFQDKVFYYNDGPIFNLGDPASPGVVVGSPIVMYGTTAVIDFSAGVVDGYNFQYADPNDPAGALYELRWGVISAVNNGAVVSKRIVLGCRQLNSNQLAFAANLDSMVEKF